MWIFIFIFIFNFCYNIAQIDDDLIASEIHESVLNEFPNDGKNIVTCEEEIVDWNKYPIDEMGLSKNTKIEIQ